MATTLVNEVSGKERPETTFLFLPHESITMMITMKQESEKNKMSNIETFRLDGINYATGEDSVSLTWISVSQNDKSSLNQDS